MERVANKLIYLESESAQSLVSYMMEVASINTHIRQTNSINNINVINDLLTVISNNVFESILYQADVISITDVIEALSPSFGKCEYVLSNGAFTYIFKDRRGYTVVLGDDDVGQLASKMNDISHEWFHTIQSERPFDSTVSVTTMVGEVVVISCQSYRENRDVGEIQDY